MKTGHDLINWDETWEDDGWGKYYGVEQYVPLAMSLQRVLHRFLKVDSDKKILELGCAKGKKLIEFGKKYGYQLYGIDTSPNGVVLARENIKSAHLQGNIFCEDMFQTSLEKESFDIVYSMGLIEHFDNPSEAIDVHIKLLKKNGILILNVPNVGKSFNMAIRKMLNQDDITATHNIRMINKDYLRNIMQNRGVKLLFLDYVGCVDIMLGFSHANKFVMPFVMLTNQAIGYLTFFMPSSTYFSPYLLIVARKD